MMTVLKYIEKKGERWFAIHPSLIILFLIAPYFRPFGISMFHSLWPIEVLGNLWGLGAFVLTMLLCMALRVRLGRVWWLFISVYALTAVSTLITGLTTLLPASLLHFVSASNLIDVVGMTGQALGLAAAVLTSVEIMGPTQGVHAKLKENPSRKAAYGEVAAVVTECSRCSVVRSC